MQLVRFDPFKRLLDDDNWPTMSQNGLKIHETETDIIAQAVVAGIPAENVEANIVDGVLTIKAEVKEEDKTAVEAAITELKEVKDKEDVDELQKKIQTLSDAIQKVGAAMYEQGAQQPGDAGTVDPTEKEIPSEEKPVDAEYTEVPKDGEATESGDVAVEDKKE